MKGKLILVPCKEPKEGMKVVYIGKKKSIKNKIDTILTEPVEGYDILELENWGGNPRIDVKISELQQIAIEYENWAGFDLPRMEKYSILLSPDMYEKALPLIGQEVEFIIWDGGRQVIGEPEFEPVAWIQESTPSPIVYTEEEVKLLTATAMGHVRGDVNYKNMWSDWWDKNKKK